MVLLTVTMSPLNAGIRARRRVAAMHPPVVVPANGGPEMTAAVTRPDGMNVMRATALPEGSPSFLQVAACPAADSSAERSAVWSSGGASLVAA